METKLIAFEDCCTVYNIEFTFLEALQEFGLIEVVVSDNRRFLSEDHLHELERCIRLHHDLGINMQGIDAISHLLKRIAVLQEELSRLRFSQL